MPELGLRAALRRRWDALAARLGADPAASDRIIEMLLEAYDAENRHYHRLSHLAFLFGEIARHAHRIGDRDRLELAAWFHDWIHDTQRNDNEERSADTAEDMLAEMRIAPPLRNRVTALIRMTKNHRSAGDADDDLFLDMDFAILGAPPGTYDRYAGQVRAEYGWVPDALFNAGRAEFLRSALARPRVFLTDTYEAELGEQARENIARELARLDG